MKFTSKKLVFFSCFLAVLTLTACGISSDMEISFNRETKNSITFSYTDDSSIDKIVPAKETLIEN